MSAIAILNLFCCSHHIENLDCLKEDIYFNGKYVTITATINFTNK